MTDAEKLTNIKTALEETDDSCRALTDAQLSLFLVRADGDWCGAVYLGAIQKARIDSVTLPDGTTLPSSRDYWLGIAAGYRPNRGGVIPRADGR